MQNIFLGPNTQRKIESYPECPIVISRAYAIIANLQIIAA